MIYRCRNVLCGHRSRIPNPSGLCRLCAAPTELVDEEYDEEDAIRDGMESILDGFSLLLSQNDVFTTGTSEEGIQAD